VRPGPALGRSLLLALAAAVLAACHEARAARPADQIEAGTVARLGVAWEFDTGTTRGLEATPVVADGVMYASGVAGRVYALDAASGRLIWKFEPRFDPQVVRNVCCDEVNRGVALAAGRVYVAALDGRLYALDARTGAVQWSVDTIVDHLRGYSSTGAPQVAGDVVAIGQAGGDADARGYVSAYDLASGALKWRFFTVPGPPGKPYEHPELAQAARTWDPNSRWDLGGGGAVWGPMTYDPDLGLLYVGTGNPIAYPRHARSPSGGDNLFTCSILAIEAKTGRLAWHYQEVPGDQWDYDADSPMLLTSLKIGGVERPVLMQAAKDGFFYVLDRRSGQLLAAHRFVQVNWARGVDLKSGRPALDAAADYSTGAKLVRPAPIGAHDWRPIAYDPRTGLAYLAATESGAVMVDESARLPHRPGLGNTGTQLALTAYIPKDRQDVPARMRPALEGAPDLGMSTWLRAIDPVSGRIAWQAEAPGGWWDRAGVLTTGGLVVQGTGTGLLRAFDAASGRLLKQIDLQTGIIAAPTTYQAGGVQYLAVMAGWGGGGWSIPHPESAAYRFGPAGRIIALRLDGAPPRRLAPVPPPGPIPPPPARTGSAAQIRRGERLFEQDCSDCHTNLDGSAAPDLRRMTPEAHDGFRRIVLEGALLAGGMPRWDDVLSGADADAIHAYLIALSAQAYDAQQRALPERGSTAKPSLRARGLQ
jgi:quinohemoprotein ethanol dehydrogenase